MHSMDNDRPPKRPAVPSLASAQAAIDHWLAENRMDSVKDGDGTEWRLAVAVDHVPDPADAKGVLWRLRIRATLGLTPAQMLATGILDAEKDERLLSLIGDEAVDLSMKPLTYTAPSEEALRLVAADEVPRLRDGMAGSPLLAVKRQLLCRLVDERGIFGGG